MKKCSGIDNQVSVKIEQKRQLEEETPLPVLSDDIDRNFSKPLYVPVHPCGLKIPDNGTVDGYPKLEQASCTFCDEMCQAPDIDASIKFFDGFDTKTVVITYVVMGVFTIAWQIYIQIFKRKQVSKEYDEIINHQDFRQSNVDNINQTASKEFNPYKQM